MAEQRFSSRAHHLESTRTWSTLPAVAEAVVAASDSGARRIYVETKGGRYRWSLTAIGGGYPLLRVAARFLEVDHRRIFVGFRTLEDGTAVLCEDPDQHEAPERWRLIEVDRSVDAVEATSLIAAVL